MKSLKSTIILFFAIILIANAQSYFELDKNFLVSNIAFDQQGNKIVVGSITGDTDFDPGSGEFLLGVSGGSPAVIASYNPSNELNFAIEISDADITPNVIIESLSTDSDNNIYVHGLFIGKADLDPGPAIFELTAASVFEYRTFTASYDTEGNFRFAFALPQSQLTFLASSSLLFRASLKVDEAGNSYFLYRPTFYPIFDADPGPEEVILESNTYILSYDTNGNFRFANEVPLSTNAIDVNPSGNIVVTGQFNSFDTDLDFDPGPEVTVIEDASNSVFFIASYNNTGSLNFVNKIEGAGNANSIITLMPQGDIILVGRMAGIIDFDPSSAVYEVSLSTFEFDSGDLFLAKYDSNGSLINAFAMEDKVGQVSTEVIYDVGLNPAGQLFIFGQLNNGTVDFDPSEAEAELWGGDTSIEFVACYDSDFNLQFLHNYDFIGYNYGQLAIHPDCPFYSFYARLFSSSPLDIDPGSGSVELTGNSNAIITILPEELDNPNNCSLSITSISENDLIPIQVYPNPVQSELTIDLGDQSSIDQVAIFNLLGQQVFNQKTTHSSIQIDLSSLPEGPYLLRFMDRNGVLNQTQQLVKQ